MAIEATSKGGGSKSTIKIFANIFISFIGAGVLGLPYAFKEAGILEGISVMTLVGLLSVKAMLLIVDCKYRLIEKQEGPSHSHSSYKKKMVAESTEEIVQLLEMEDGEVSVDEPSIPKAPRKDLTYGDVGFYALGNIGRGLIDFSIVITQTGFCCAYLIFISENLSSYMPGTRTYHWLLVMLPILWCLTLLRHLSTLAITSLFAQVSNLMAFAVVFWFDFEHFNAVKMHPKTISIQGLPFFFAIAIYCYEGAGMILSLESSLHEQVRHQFKTFFVRTMVLVTSLYITFGACGYLSFGAYTNSIITLNLPKAEGMDFSIVVKTCLCLALFLTYPVMMFPVVKLLENKLFRENQNHVWQGNMLRLGMVILTGVIVLVVPNFTNLMALVGAGCCTLLAFILPAIFHLTLFKGSLTKWQLAIDVTLILLGILGAIVGTIDAVKRMTGHTVTTASHHEPISTTTSLTLHNITNYVVTTAKLIIHRPT